MHVHPNVYVAKGQERLKLTRKGQVVECHGRKDPKHNAAIHWNVQPCKPTKEVPDEDYKTYCPLSGDTIGKNNHGPNVIVEFDDTEMIAQEGMTHPITVPVRRAGQLKGWVECDWHIENGNVLDSVFKLLSQREGTIRFEDGQSYQTIHLDIPHDPTWNVEGLYFCYLHAVRADATEGLRPACGLNTVIHIYTVNNDPFPSGTVKDEKRPRKLILGFIRHNREELPKETMLGIIYSLILPVFNLIETFVTREVVNKISAGSDATGVLFEIFELDSVSTALSCCALLFVGTEVLKSFVANQRQILRLGGKGNRLLRANIFCTMLQFSDRAKENFAIGDVGKALDTEVLKSIKCIWVAAFEMLEVLVDSWLQLLVTIGTVFWTDINILGKTIAASTIPVMGMLTVLVLLMRWGKLVDLNDKALTAERHWASFVAMCESRGNSVRAYCIGWILTNIFTTIHAAWNKLDAAADDCFKRTNWGLQIIFAGCVAVVVKFVGELAIQGQMTVGDYNMLFNAVTKFEKNLIKIATILNTMVSAAAAVENIADILNSDTQRGVRVEREKWSADGNGIEDHDAYYQASTDIVVKDIVFCYDQCCGTAAVTPCNARIPSDAVSCFPQTSVKKAVGINTFFKLLSGTLLADEGTIDRPERWKVIYIAVEPLLYTGSLMYNLTLHANEFNEKTNRDDKDQMPLQEQLQDSEIWALCEALGMSKELNGKSNLDIGQNGTVLRQSDKVIIMIAQAVIYGTDLLLISSVLDSLGPVKAARVLRALHEYVKSKGWFTACLRLPKELRHNKTLLYTTKSVDLWHNPQPDYLITEPDAGCLEQFSGMVSTLRKATTQNLESARNARNKENDEIALTVETPIDNSPRTPGDDPGPRTPALTSKGTKKLGSPMTASGSEDPGTRKRMGSPVAATASDDGLRKAAAPARAIRKSTSMPLTAMDESGIRKEVSAAASAAQQKVKDLEMKLAELQAAKAQAKSATKSAKPGKTETTGGPVAKKKIKKPKVDKDRDRVD